MPAARRRRTPSASPRRTRPAIRRAKASDLPAILRLEQACFQPYRRASAASLRRSLRSRRQSVWLIDGDDGLDALLVLWHHPRVVRVYDIATHPRRQGEGLGHALMAHAEEVARQGGQKAIGLEADPKEPGLVAWYERQGFVAVRRLPAYYQNGNAALRLVKPVA